MTRKEARPAEYKTFPSISLKVNEEHGIVEHIITVFGILDHGNDISHPGCFTKTIAERGDRVRVLDMHKTDSIRRVLGKPLELREIGRDELPRKVLEKYPEATGGLRATTKYFIDTPEGKGAFIRAKEDAVEYSYGYDPLDTDETDVKRNGEMVRARNLRTVRLWEYGPVIFGMCPGTATLSAKSEEPAESKPAPDVTENTIRIRVRDPDDFDPDAFGDGEKFKVIDIGPKAQGIQATIGKLKGESSTTIQGYIFDKDKFTVEEAQAWVDEHKKDALLDLDEKQNFERVTYNGVMCQATGRRGSDRDGKKYVRTVRYDGDERDVHYGDPDMPMRRSDPEARANFLARHNCDGKQDPFTPGFWACYDWQNTDEKQTAEEDAEAIVPTEQDEGPYRCECLECGHVMKSEEHCRDIECPECGGAMRRAERPGVGAKDEEEPEEVKFTGSPRNPYGTHSSRGYPGGREAWQRAWRVHLSGVRDQGPVQGTVRRVSMIAAGMKPPCKIPEMSAEDLGPRPGKCGKLDGSYREKPSDYGLDSWKSPSDDDLEREEVQLTCQDLTDLKRICLQEIEKRRKCKEEGKWDESVSQLESKEIDEAWLWEMGIACDSRNIMAPWDKSIGPTEPTEAQIFASIMLQNVATKLAPDGWEHKAALLAAEKLRHEWGEADAVKIAELERKVGRVLAARNAQRIAAAMTALLQVLEDAGIDIPGFGKEPTQMEEEEEEGKDYALDVEILGAELDLLEME